MPGGPHMPMAVRAAVGYSIRRTASSCPRWYTISCAASLVLILKQLVEHCYVQMETEGLNGGGKEPILDGRTSLWSRLMILDNQHVYLHCNEMVTDGYAGHMQRGTCSSC